MYKMKLCIKWNFVNIFVEDSMNTQVSENPNSVHTMTQYLNCGFGEGRTNEPQHDKTN